MNIPNGLVPHQKYTPWPLGLILLLVEVYHLERAAQENTILIYSLLILLRLLLTWSECPKLLSHELSDWLHQSMLSQMMNV